ncbi:MAG: SDR family oxidoreductase, partial [Betaproteobacteria bacterium]
KRLNETGRFSIKAAVRDGSHNFPPDVFVHSGLDLSDATNWMPILSEVDCVIHTAARVHVMHGSDAETFKEFRRINVEGTMNLARQSAAAGVRRFVFISSIKVNGEGTKPGEPFTANDTPAAVDPYSVSKREAEDGLLRLAANTKMDIVIIRPPLVYGPGVKANFHNMMSLLCKGVHLPLGAVHNKRSLVSLGNLVDLIVTCVEHPAAANQVFLVSDSQDLSTTELLIRMGNALGQPARLWPVPTWILTTGAVLMGKRGLSQRLCGSLQVDILKTRTLLGWSPPQTVDEGLRLTAEQFIIKLGQR